MLPFYKQKRAYKNTVIAPVPCALCPVPCALCPVLIVPPEMAIASVIYMIIYSLSVSSFAVTLSERTLKDKLQENTPSFEVSGPRVWYRT